MPGDLLKGYLGAEKEDERRRRLLEKLLRRLKGGGGFAETNELQDFITKAQKGETATDPRLNRWVQENIPEWIVEQEFDFKDVSQRQHPGIQEMIANLFQAPGMV